MVERSNRDFDFQSFKKYMEGAGSDSGPDTFDIEQWLTDPEKVAELHQKSIQFWDDIPLDPDVPEYDGMRILDRIHHQIKLSEARFMTPNKPAERFIAYITRVAAVLLIPVLLTAVFFYSKVSTSPKATSYSEIYAPVGTRTSFSLPDGSTGWMNGGSTLKFSSLFSGKTRQVELTGEAYFNVTKNKARPFIVSTANIEVKVYGTSFNVMAYPDETTTEVTLEQGKVEVYKKKHNAVESIGILNPDQECIYNHSSDSRKIIPVRSSEIISWKDGKLIFKYEPFSEVIHKINRWYNVNIVIKDKVLESYVYYGTFRDETLDEVLKLMKLTAPITYRDLGRERKPDGTFERRNIELYYTKLTKE